MAAPANRAASEHAPKLAVKLARGGWGGHLLDLATIRRIESEDFC